MTNDQDRDRFTTEHLSGAAPIEFTTPSIASDWWKAVLAALQSGANGEQAIERADHVYRVLVKRVNDLQSKMQQAYKETGLYEVKPK